MKQGARRSIILAVAAIATTASTTFAADMTVKTPAAAPTWSWSGFYAGVNIGGAWGSHNVTFAPNDPATAGLFALGAAAPPASFRTSGGLGGLQFGYNWQIERHWLVGLETDFDWSGIKGSALNPYQSVVLGSQSMPVSERIPWFGTARARFGFLPTENLLAYVTGGLVYAEVDHAGNYTNSSGGFTDCSFPFAANCVVGVPCFAGSPSGTATGWSAGGGLELAVSQHFSLKAEYLYLSLASRSINELATSLIPGGGAGQIPASFTASFNRTNLNVARAGVNYRF
jgi:outer membrane immunogenic protein